MAKILGYSKVSAWSVFRGPGPWREKWEFISWENYPEYVFYRNFGGFIFKVHFGRKSFLKGVFFLSFTKPLKNSCHCQKINLLMLNQFSIYKLIFNVRLHFIMKFKLAKVSIENFSPRKLNVLIFVLSEKRQAGWNRKRRPFWSA